MRTKESNVKQYRGDGLHIQLESNDQILEVSGDGCRVTLASNSGSIRMIGDGCLLTVTNNSGDIEYRGDGGHIVLDAGSQSDKIKYVGDGGRVSFGGKAMRMVPRKVKRISKSMSAPESENLVNECKEANLRFVADDETMKTVRGSVQRKAEKGFPRSKTITVTQIPPGDLPKVSNGRLGRRWFMRSFGATAATTNLP